MISQRHPKQVDGEAVLIVFRAGVVLPIVILTVAILLFVIAIGFALPHVGEFSFAAWIAGTVPIVVLRPSVIFTSSSFLVKRPIGRALKISLVSIKRSYILSAGKLRIEFLAGNKVDLRVPDTEAIVYLLNKSAGGGLNFNPLEDFGRIRTP